MTIVIDSPTDSSTPGADASAPSPHHPVWARAAIIIGVIAALVALVAGLGGLMGNPVVGTDSNGLTTLHGSFEPFPCPGDLPRCAQGYVRAGGRSVFVRFPPGCPPPAREQAVTVRAAVAAPRLGMASYMAARCAETG